MNDIKVSVIIPIYNGEKFLDKTLLCLCKQTLKEIEFILVNDASTDKSFDIMTKFKAEFPDKFVLLNNETNKGPGGARNFGLSVARGEYIGFVDSDDIVKPKMFELLYNKAKEKNSDVVMCAYFNEKTDKVIFIDTHKFENGLTLDARANLIIYNGFVWCCIFKKEFLNTLNMFFREKIHIYEDIDFLLEVHSKAETVDFVNKALYRYKNTEGSLSKPSDKNQTATESERMMDELFKSILDRCRDSKHFEEIREAIEYKILEKSVSHLLFIIKNGKLSYKIISRLNKLLKKYIEDYSQNPYKNNYTKYLGVKTIKGEIIKAYDMDSRKFYDNIIKLEIVVK